MWCVGECNGKKEPIEFNPKDDNGLICWDVISHKDFETKEEAEEWIEKAVKCGNDYYTVEELYQLNKQKDSRIEQLESFIRGTTDTNERFLRSLQPIKTERTQARVF